MSKSAELYKRAHAIVFGSYPRWKASAVESDWKARRESSTLDSFAKDVEAEMSFLEIVVPFVQQLCERACSV
jgi:hypothetical protein